MRPHRRDLDAVIDRLRLLLLPRQPRPAMRALLHPQRHRLVRLRMQLAPLAGAPLALLAPPPALVGLLSPGGRQRRIGRRLGRLAQARLQCLHPRQRRLQACPQLHDEHVLVGCAQLTEIGKHFLHAPSATSIEYIILIMQLHYCIALAYATMPKSIFTDRTGLFAAPVAVQSTVPSPRSNVSITRSKGA